MPSEEKAPREGSQRFEPYPARDRADPHRLGVSFLVSRMERLHKSKESFLCTSVELRDAILAWDPAEAADAMTTARAFAAIKLANSNDLHDSWCDARSGDARRLLAEATHMLNDAALAWPPFSESQRRAVTRWHTESSARVAAPQTSGVSKKQMQRVAHDPEKVVVSFASPRDLSEHLRAIVARLLEQHGRCLIETLLHSHFPSHVREAKLVFQQLPTDAAAADQAPHYVALTEPSAIFKIFDPVNRGASARSFRSFLEEFPNFKVEGKFVSLVPLSELEEFPRWVARPSPPGPVAHAMHQLGVPQDASLAEVRTEFRRLALLFHPDKAEPGTPDSRHRFQSVHAAFELVRDWLVAVEGDSSKEN
eukprot:TRINITY_DN21376_c0_g1_i1.p1 TRINITY_DN21376_c0_g1~~TRINITY_DN21376_c0_g1_i1.p1  ORF type:complete len:365 (-),score=45.40 TRINITY_DN21376_c0_g1_i1:8-1102(-)